MGFQLVTTTAQFALGLVESTSQLIDHNMAKLEHQVPPSPLGGVRIIVLSAYMLMC